ncbi:MAG: sulfotransferase [Alphaproteobacteria bacterium]|nr:sulfotransferase [Alphaproteobacteria bacterium]
MSALVTPSSRWVLNRLGDAARTVGLTPALTPDSLIAAARRRSGLQELGDWEYPEALAQICESIEAEAELSTFGRIAVRELLIGGVEQRLRLIELERRAPERVQGEVRPPIIIVGLPRSGTTLMHRLLSETPGLRGVPTWEVFTPLHEGSPQARRAKVAPQLEILPRLAPELFAKHVIHPDQHEEEVSWFGATLWSPAPWRACRCYRYKRWQLAQDPLPAYRSFRAHARFAQTEQPEARLVLKLPNHTAFVSQLLEVLPDATLVRIHRDPVPVIASYCSLAETMHGINSERVDRAGLGRASLDLWATHHARFAASDIPAARLIEFDYEEVRSDPVGASLRVLEKAGHMIQDEDVSHLRAVAAERPQHQHGRHVYQLSDYGLSEGEVREAIPWP